MIELTDEIGDDVIHGITRLLNIDYGDDDQYIIAFASEVIAADSAQRKDTWREAIDEARLSLMTEVLPFNPSATAKNRCGGVRP